MSSSTRWVIIGAALAVVVVGAVVGGLILLRGGADDKPPSKVVVSFAMPGEDGAVTAQLVTAVDVANGSYKTVDATQTVSIPGTSYTQLRDAYPFGGAEAVATALDGGSLKPGTAWVDVTQSAWEKLLQNGIDVTIKEPFDTFDDVAERYTEFEAGPQHVAAADLRALVIGMTYLEPDARQPIVDALASASMKALASASPGSGIETDMTDEQWAAFAKAASGR